MTPPADARLRELAKIGARICHEDLFDRALNIDGEPTEGHENLSDGAQGFDSWGFDRCPHPDCVLVRSAVSSSQTWQPDWKPICCSKHGPMRLMLVRHECATCGSLNEIWWPDAPPNVVIVPAPPAGEPQP